MDKKFREVKKNNGFTLVELIVTIAVSVIVLSASVAGIVAWVHHADFVRNENYAETIYYAAQSELTRYRSNGQLRELEEYVIKNNQIVPVENIVVTPSIDKDAYRNRLYFLKKDAGNIEEGNPLGGLLEPYIYDGSILEGAVCVEFDPGDGTVYSVSYSDRNNIFTYEATPGEGEVSLLNRERDVRKRNRVGYYSTDLSAAAPDAVGKTRLDQVQLINENQLYLRWSLPEHYKNIRGFLTYTLEIYDKEKNVPDYTFTVKGSELKEKDSGDITQNIVECTEADTGDVYAFTAYMDADGAMYLVLDSIDYGVEPEKITLTTNPSGEDSFDISGLRNSASVLQLFAEPEDIYVRVQAQGTPYKTSAWKQSNTSNTMFASMKEEAAGKDIYMIENARHLYNVRYRERESGLVGMSKNIYYRQSADITWLKTDEKLYHSVSDGAKMKQAALQAGDKCMPAGTTEGVPYFPAIPSLGINSTLEVSGLRKYELKDFVLYGKTVQTGETQAEEDSETAVPGSNPAAGKLGLVAENGGKIQGLTISNIYAEGVKNVGAVCGVNSGKGNISSVQVAGRVTGEENIGGIAGLDQAGSDGAYGGDPGKGPYTGLVNRAEVSAAVGKTGGIIGSISAGTKVTSCENYGAVRGTEKYTAYIGGIVGYNRGTVEDCISAPKDKPVMKDDGKELDTEKLKGIFVGGIAGYNNKGTIKNSGTEKESKDSSGNKEDAYIIGYRYVGGIVGYNNQTVDAGDSGLVFFSTARTNKAQVVGSDYVGGIVGANALLDGIETEEDTIPAVGVLENCEVKKVYSEKMLVKNWINEGIVHAAGSYAGGIAGYNAGILQSCTTKINTSSDGGSTLLAQAVLYGHDASYVGGITGCNMGWIHNDKNVNGSATVQVNSVVAGKKYIGGIAGYNGTTTGEDGSAVDKSGVIENYALAGGYISGECFVGGYVGLNTTEKLLGESELLLSKPNEVTADYFAGGVMGALILVPENSNDIMVNCATDNFFGEVEAKNAFAGGYVAYTQLLREGGADVSDARAEELYRMVTKDEIKQNINSVGAGRQSALQELSDSVLDDGRCGENKDSNVPLKFVYNGNQGENRFASIKAPIFAGGIIGFNSWNTTLLLQGINNKVQVEATDSVSYSFISAGQGEVFSFVGGTIGLVTPKATVDNCKNINGGGVAGVGTFTGGIAEVNLGLIRNCTAGSIGGQSNFGGIVGLNTNDGIVSGCTLDGQISGESYLGGIAVRNESIIEDCVVKNSAGSSESAVIGTGEYVGGIVAVDRLKEKNDMDSAGRGTYENRIKNCRVEANIGAQNMGRHIGGLAGRYEGGELDNNRLIRQAGEGGNGGEENITVYGSEQVGGIAGEICVDLRGGETKAIVNEARVVAVDAAGGIGGEFAENVVVAYCDNAGEITATQGKAGGIVSELGENNTVEDCHNRGSVLAVRMAGGITAENYGIVQRCTTTGDSGAEVIVESVDTTGGIAGENRRTISGCSLTGNVVVRNVDDGKGGKAVGGITGINDKNGLVESISARSENGRKPQIRANGNGNYLGGAVGINMGTVDGTGGKIDLGVNLESGQKGAVGGVVSANGNTVQNISFAGEAAGTDDIEYGTGGVVGRNEFNGEPGVISGCRLDGGTVRAESDYAFSAGWEEKASGIYLGGICGINPEGGTVKNCTLTGSTSVSGRNGFIGGIAGYNLGELNGNRVSEGDTSVVTIQNGRGNKETGVCVLGGIAGYNGETGVVKDCSTGIKWKVDNSKSCHFDDKGAITSASINDEKHPTGGIIGCNQSVHDQSGLVNRAEVKGLWMTGGIIGLQKTEKRSGFTIEDCENFGNVRGEIRTAGGIISDWRHQGGTVRKCINNGAVSIKNSDSPGTRNSAGGIIGAIWWSSDISISAERCGNNGDIYYWCKDDPKENSEGTNGQSGRAGGISGGCNTNSMELTFTAEDCYNAGRIQNGDGISAGISAGKMGSKSVKATFVRCVNYGRGTVPTKDFYGIAYNCAIQNMSQCLNAGYNNKVNNSLVDQGGNGGNYFFSYITNVITNVRNDGKGNLCVASFYSNDGKFHAANKTEFKNNRLYNINTNNTGQYIQFTNVGAAFGTSGASISISALKTAFSADAGEKYALLRFGDDNQSTLNPPSNVVIEEIDGIYQISYEIDSVTGVYTTSYLLDIYADDDMSKAIYHFEITDATVNKWKIEGEEAEKLQKALDDSNCKKIRATVTAKTTQKLDDQGQPVCSVPSDPSAEFYLKRKLPRPKVHFEMIYEKKGAVAGYWVLENMDEYTALSDAAGWKVTVAVDENNANSVTFDSGKGGRVYSVMNISSEGFIRVEAIASMGAGGTYQDSDLFSERVHIFRPERTIQAEQKDKDKGYIGEFIGIKADNISYRLTLKQVGGEGHGYHQWLDITYRVDMLLKGKNGAEELLGSNTVTLPNNYGTADCVVSLSGLPEDTIRKIINCVNGGGTDKEGNELSVRFYPWEMDGLVKYYTTDTGEEKSSVIAAGTSNFNNSLVVLKGWNTLKGKYEMYPTPKLMPPSRPNMEIVDGTIKYELYWDAAADIENPANYANAKYTVTVTGKNADAQIVLYQREITSTKEEDRKIILTENNWKYDKLILKVERIGNESGGVHYIGSSAEKSYDIPIRLDAVAKPTATLPDQNNLIYEIKWGPSAEKTVVKGYRIIMKGKKKDGTPVQEIEVDVDGVDTAVKNIDLSEYPVLDNVETIEFSIVVLSRDTSKYLDSRQSPGTVCEIPARLPEPAGERILLLEDVEVDEKTEALETEKFTQFELKQVDDKAALENAVYEIEYFITDAGETPENWTPDADRPEQDEDKGIYISAGPLRMTGNLREATIALQELDAYQAGRQLWYRIRGVSDNMVSSIWTDWESKTLPKAKLRAVEMEEQTAENEWPYTISTNGTVSGDGYKVKMSQPKLRFGTVDFAAGYELLLREADRTVENEDGTEETITGSEHLYTLYENPDADSDEVLLLSDSDGNSVTPAEEIVEDETTVYSYELYDVVHSFKVESSGTTHLYEITVTAKLFYSVKDQTVQEIWLELPEGKCLDSGGNEIGERDFTATTAMDVTVMPPLMPGDDPDDPRYVVEELVRWQRVEDKDDPTKNTTVIEKVGVTKAGRSIEAVQGYYLEELDADLAGDDLPEMFRMALSAEEELEELEEPEITEEKEKPQEENSGKSETGKTSETGKVDVSGNEIERRPDSDERE